MGVLEQVVRTRDHRFDSERNLLHEYSGQLFGKTGKKWLAGLPLPDDEKAIVGRLVDDASHSDHGEVEWRWSAAHEDPSNLASSRPWIGDRASTSWLPLATSRGSRPGEVEFLLRTDAEVRQSGDRSARHGRMSKQGNTHARRCSSRRRGQRRRHPVRLERSSDASNAIGAPAAAVATARKLAVMIWYVLRDGTEYAYARPAFTAMKLRKAALKAGAPREMERRNQVAM